MIAELCCLQAPSGDNIGRMAVLHIYFVIACPYNTGRRQLEYP